ncbi:MAG: hypothetical protein ACE5F9_01325 [Phycisphaerae bacterium]
MMNADTVQTLATLRTRFGPRVARRKVRLVSRAARSDLSDARTLRTCHDLLMFMAAYPDDRDVLRAVEAALRCVARIARQQTEALSRRNARRLQDSGIAGTITCGSFTLDAVDWLTRRFPPSVELSFDDESAGPALDDFLPALVAPVERDGLLSDRQTTRQWLRLAAGGRERDSLAWLAAQFRRLHCGGETLDRVFDSLELSVRWRLRDPAASRTTIRFPRRPLFFQSAALERRVSLLDVLGMPLPPPRRMTAQDARRMIDIGRATLCVRHRETDTLTYADPHEVALFSLERGIDVALFAMTPDRRLPIESYFGFLVARNRVPVGYGGGWVLFDRSEIGVNVFDEFRGGESACIFSQVLRVFHHYYGARRFEVDPYQFGADNPEAIRSGAFWFYYRLGFRPAEPRLAALADRQWRRINKEPSYRSAARVLRRLAESTLVFTRDAAPEAEAVDLSALGLAVTRRIGRRFHGDRRSAEQAAQSAVKAALGVRRRPEWPANQAAAFDRLCVLMALIPDLESWPIADKSSLVAIMRAKGGPTERTYARRLQRHGRLRAALARLARAESRRNAPPDPL